MKTLPFLLCCFLLTACIEPTLPEFQIEEPFVLIEGNIQAGDGTSEIRISRSIFEKQLTFEEIENATVVTVAEDGRTVNWLLTGSRSGTYQPEPGAIFLPEENWHCVVTLTDGSQFISEPETIPASVELKDLDVRFEQESRFDEGRSTFIPEFQLFIDFDDPPDQTNYYRWSSQHYQRIVICASCEPGSVYNPVTNSCVFGGGTNRPRYDYACNVPTCYERVPTNAVVLATDELSDGNRVQNVPIGGITFEDFGPMLVEVFQFSLTEAGFAYNKVIADLLNSNSGLNATTPAALNGNLRNTDPDGIEVLGFVGGVYASRRIEFIVRDRSIGTPTLKDRRINLPPSPPEPPRAPCDGPFRNPLPPEGWP